MLKWNDKQAAAPILVVVCIVFYAQYYRITCNGVHQINNYVQQIYGQTNYHDNVAVSA